MVKRLAQGIALVLTAPAALLCGFGRISMMFTLFSHAYAMVPGIIGDFVRIAFYKMTLQACSIDSRISFGSFFAHPEASVGSGVYIGSYCVLGRVRIGDHTQIASAVQVISGKRQHGRDAEGHISGSDLGVFTTVSIGADCWIGAGAIVMADVGDRTTVGAGAIVTRSIPENSTAVGNPAKCI